MIIEQQQIGAVTVIRPEGPISGSEDAGIFRANTEGIARTTRGRLVLDATELAYVDSEGLEALLELAESLESLGQSLRTAAPGSTLRETIEITGLESHFDHYESVQEAVRSFR